MKTGLVQRLLRSRLHSPVFFLFEELIDSCEQTLSKRCERLL